MTIAEYKAALDALDDAAFCAFRREFGGDFATRQQYVDDFVFHPDHERRLCQLLVLTTEKDKAAAAGQEALNLSKEGNRLARDANAYSASHLAARQAAVVATGEQPIIFISCGQRTTEEKKLGDDITRLVRELTPFEPYFAEYQNSLEGLSKNIFGALNRCVGFVAVLHSRGTVQPQELVRASVWVEQEIAIAAFLQGALGRQLHVVAFTETAIAREGVREHLLLNPKEFTDNADVLKHLRAILPTWRMRPAVSPQINLSIQYKKGKTTQERHDYELVVLLTNHGVEPLTRFHVDLEVPTELLEQPRSNVRYVADRSDGSTALFRATQDAQGREVFPGDSLKVLSVEYFVDNRIFFDRSELLQRAARATLYAPGAAPVTVEKSFAELQTF